MKIQMCFLLFSHLLCPVVIIAQCPAGLTLQKQWEIPFSFPKQAMTVEHDRGGKPYIYVAAKEQGVLIYDISGANPVQVKQFTVSNLQNLEPMSLSQEGNYLYVALGNTFGSSNNKPGVAIIDVSSPASAVLSDTWVHSSNGNGAGIVKAEGNYAYLGAMGEGLIILDISNKNNISFVSQFIPSISFPNPNNPDKAKYNARGMAVKNGIVYLCYDAGGIRIINTSNKLSPKETGHFANALLMNRPRAYNNVVLNDSLLYVAVDYCGLEILNVQDTANIQFRGWWNPWHCESSSNTWFNSGGHTNEIAYDKKCQLVFMSSGKSEINIVSVANPAHPDSCGKYSTSGANHGTWGMGLYKDRIYAAYIFVPLGIPFSSSWGGVKMLSWGASCSNGLKEEKPQAAKLEVYPNPTSGSYYVVVTDLLLSQESFRLFDMQGREIAFSLSASANGSKGTRYQLSMHSGIAAGCYLLQVKTDEGLSYKKLLKAE